MKKKSISKKPKEEVLTRELLNIKKDHSEKSHKRRYFVTSAIAGAPVDARFFWSITTYCEKKKAELVVLPMRGVSKKDCGYDLKVQPFLSTEFIFNKNLKAQDFMLSPQMINPLTGLNRFGQKDSSLIIASPKQSMRTVPVSHESPPHIIQSTGTCTLPRYASTRQGCLAHQDHCLGGVIVEIEDDRTFYIRQVQADSNKGFYDLSEYFCENEVEGRRASAFIAGDLHSGFEDETALSSWLECIRVTKAKYIILHDLFDGHSITHHHKNDIQKQVTKELKVNTLEKELQQMVQCLDFWCGSFPDSHIIIVPSNHNEFLERYLSEVRYSNDRVNHQVAVQLAAWHLQKLNPLEKYAEIYCKYKNLRWLKREKDYKLHDVHIGAHGDKGSNGSRGSIQQAELSYGNAVIGHSHSPGILRNIWQVGTSTKLLLDYNIGSPSSWLHASCLLYKEGKRQMIISIKGKWKL